MGYRGLIYFFFISLFMYVSLFSHVIILRSNKKISLLNKILPQNKVATSTRIVETFIELEKPKDKSNISNLDSKAQGKLTKEKGYNYYNDIRFFYELVKEQKIEQKSNKSANPVQKTEKTNVKKVPDFLPNLYVKEKAVINLNSDGVVGINAQKRPYVKYLLVLAKKIFYNWVKFIPGMQIQQKLIQTDKNGVIEGSVVMYFSGQELHYNLVMGKAFLSPTMNALTKRSFEYLELPAPPKDVKLSIVFIHLHIDPSTIRASAEFKFNLEYKNKKVEE